MGDILRSPINGRAILLTPRTGSHSLVVAAIAAWWPNTVVPDDGSHPALYIPEQDNWNGHNQDVAVVVRNPVERFRSMIAHRKLDVERQLASPMYGPIEQGAFVRYFRFEDGLDAVAEWLGLPTPVPQEDASDKADKPTLTPEQDARVREIYADDIALWESL